MSTDKGTDHFRFMTRTSVVLLFLTPAAMYILIPLLGASHDVVIERLSPPWLRLYWLRAFL